jgi:HTH-type transcriptional regulator/antitoxin HigA
MARIIHTDAEHHDALAALDRLMEIDPESGTAEADDLELLALVVEEYEKARWPIDLPDPVDAIRFRMDQQSLTRRDLEPTSAVAPGSPRCSRANARSACA